MVVRLEEGEQSLGMDCSMSSNAPSRFPSGRRSQPARPAKGCGMGFLLPIELDTAFQIFGMRIKLSFQKSNSLKSARKQAKQHMWNDGMGRCGNAVDALFVKPFLSPHQHSCILLVWTCFFIATIWKGPSFSYDPLPNRHTAHARPRSFAQPSSHEPA